ncbi:MAG: sulfotransferase domain-containing protein [Chloroflexi bacterium]|nr:sulfotransferase domain-containing protein [Chloroflexota bacterium]MCY3582065.1 sulfotransferase domain-containing protein [Chloroflexota bacterium]MCY3715318.1 sulfotransferase domain-containing protein [Chloroflexota bacterium]MDE2649527.1 sulfotransferase domain-containing protein [Chloroflexota bacterium]MXX50920.1 sulfotransferase domain-containing protein [Chloroflexota bacterium]
MFVFNTIVVAAHRRSGLRWALDALRLNSPDINDSFLALEQTEASHDANIPLGRFRRELLSLPGRVLVSMQELPNATYWQGLDERLFARTILRHSPAIFVHRDGRDVMVSLYYYMQSISETVRNQSFSRFLRGDPALHPQDSGLSRPGFWAHHARAWLAQDNLLVISYDDLETRYAATVHKMTDFLAVRANARLQPLNKLNPPEEPPGLLGRLGVRKPQQPRIGRSGDWRSHFDKGDLAFFKQEAGDMMRRLGYRD